MVHVTFGRHHFNSSKARRVQTAGEDHVGVESPFIKFIDGSKDHSDLKADPRFGWSGLYRTAAMYESAKALIERNSLWSFAVEKLSDRITAAGMRHVRIDELSIALWTRPKRSFRYGRLAGHHIDER